MVVFIIYGLNILLNVTDVLKCEHVLQIKPNDVWHYIIQHTKHMKWHVRTCTEPRYRVSFD